MEEFVNDWRRRQKMIELILVRKSSLGGRVEVR